MRPISIALLGLLSVVLVQTAGVPNQRPTQDATDKASTSVVERRDVSQPPTVTAEKPKPSDGQPSPPVPQSTTGVHDTASDLREVLAVLNQQSRNAKEKDWWDKFATVSAFVSSVLIALIGLYFTHSYNRAEAARRQMQEARQNQINELDTIAKFMPYLVGENEDAKRVSILYIRELGGVRLATIMAELHPSIGTAKGLEDIAQSPTESRDDRSTAAAAANKIYDALPTVHLFYATDRAADETTKTAFGGGRGELSYGSASVSIPKVHRMGRLEQPSYLRLELKPDVDRHVMLRDVTPLDEGEWLSAIETALTSSDRPELVLAIHGYNETFQTSVLRNAQLVHDLNVGFPTLTFSWPSAGQFSSYLADAANAEWAELDCAKLLEKLSTAVNTMQLHVIAQGLGSRVIVNALTGRMNTDMHRRNFKLRNLVLVLPDIDRDLFSVKAKNITEVVHRTTVYVSNNDVSGRYASVVHGASRLAVSPVSVIAMPGIDIVDVSSKGDIQSVAALADIHRILSADEPPERRNLSPIETPEGRYWKVSS